IRIGLSSERSGCHQRAPERLEIKRRAVDLLSHPFPLPEPSSERIKIWLESGQPKRGNLTLVALSPLLNSRNTKQRQEAPNTTGLVLRKPKPPESLHPVEWEVLRPAFVAAELLALRGSCQKLPIVALEIGPEGRRDTQNSLQLNRCLWRELSFTVGDLV